MDQQEAERIAQAIRQSGLTNLHVYEVQCMNHLTQDYQVKCGYRGKSKRLGDVHLEGGIMLCRVTARLDAAGAHHSRRNC